MIPSNVKNGTTIIQILVVVSAELGSTCKAVWWVKSDMSYCNLSLYVKSMYIFMMMTTTIGVPWSTKGNQTLHAGLSNHPYYICIKECGYVDCHLFFYKNYQISHQLSWFPRCCDKTCCQYFNVYVLYIIMIGTSIQWESCLCRPNCEVFSFTILSTKLGKVMFGRINYSYSGSCVHPQ